MSEKPVTIRSASLVGVDAVPVTIEATLHSEPGPPKILGRVDGVVREAYHRILTAFRADHLAVPRGAPTINFVPAGLPKSGTGYDLPMALALASASGVFPPANIDRVGAIGEISLEGRILPTRGAVAVALTARRHRWRALLMSPRDAALAAVVPGAPVFAVEHIADALMGLAGAQELARAQPAPIHPAEPTADLADIRGHETPKLALMVAAAGRHNLLFVGPPGSGKSALLRRLPGLLPPPTADEALDILNVQTIADLDNRPLAAARPLRAPHHTSSCASLLGGGSDPRPGEVTLAQHGILFLDELAEFRREALEGLRQPLEDGRVTIGRALRTVVLPADFLLVAATNPCACGYWGHPRQPCACSDVARRRYTSRISGPLRDRLDLQVVVPALPPNEMRRAPDLEWSTTAMAERVASAIDRQMARNRVAGGRPLPNARLADSQLERVAAADDAVLDTLEEVLTRQRLSGRTRVRLMRVARTIADLEGRERVTPGDVLGAARLRGVAE